MDGGPLLQKVEYWKLVHRPTLGQYLWRRWVREAMRQTKGAIGVSRDPETGRLAPVSAQVARAQLKGMTSEQIAAMHPQWVEDYSREHPDEH